MITIKSEREISLMKQAGFIVALAHKAVKEAIKPGVSTLYLDQVAEKVIKENNATPSFKGYGGFPGSICASINNVVVHGIPSEKKILKEGDIIAIDIGACYQGYHGDSAMTHAVGKINENRQRLLEVTQAALYEGLKFAQPNNHLSDVSHAIEKYVLENKFNVVKEFTGHGIGKALHEDPYIPNFGEAGHGPVLKEGMALAIEPMVNAGGSRVKILQDNWTTVTLDRSDSAHFEHTVVITKTGHIILTKLEGSEFGV
ncbi:MAG: type I methionyl aminopeptidase [Bacilli bacterium]|nr:type I methionyl aminopeptidase [Bacilli bacterium]